MRTLGALKREIGNLGKASGNPYMVSVTPGLIGFGSEQYPMLPGETTAAYWARMMKEGTYRGVSPYDPKDIPVGANIVTNDSLKPNIVPRPPDLPNQPPQIQTENTQTGVGTPENSYVMIFTSTTGKITTSHMNFANDDDAKVQFDTLIRQAKVELEADPSREGGNFNLYKFDGTFVKSGSISQTAAPTTPTTTTTSQDLTTLATPPQAGMSMPMKVGIGVAILAGIGGAIYFSKKRR